MAVGIGEIVAKGDQLKSLIALRDRLAAELDEAKIARDIGTLAKQLVEVLEQIAAIQPTQKTKVDELAEKRAERRRNASLRRSDAQDSEQPAGID